MNCLDNSHSQEHNEPFHNNIKLYVGTDVKNIYLIYFTQHKFELTKVITY